MDRALLTMCDRKFLPGAAALLKSVREWHPDVARYCIVPQNDLEAARDSLRGLAEVRLPTRQIRGVPPDFQAAEAKVFAVELPHEVVAVVDADVIFCRPAEDLWKVEPGSVHAVRDAATTILHQVPPGDRETFRREYPDLVEAKPFNAGVFALRPQDWPELAEEFEEVLARFEEYTLLVDQVILNVILLSSVRFLPDTYNVTINFGSHIPSNPYLLHYTCNPKPWMPDYPRRRPEYYPWTRYGLSVRHPLLLWPVRTRCWYGKARIRLAEFIDRHSSLRTLWRGLRPNRPTRAPAAGIGDLPDDQTHPSEDPCSSTWEK
jgi:hypothetical protein